MLRKLGLIALYGILSFLNFITVIRNFVFYMETKETTPLLIASGATATIVFLVMLSTSIMCNDQGE